MKDVFDEWLARVICFAFSIPPSALVAQVNRATAETAQDTALSEGLAPLQVWVKQLVDQVIASEFQAPDLEFAWDEDRAVDPSDVARIAASYVAAGIKSVNEVRAELGLAAVPGGDLPARPKAPSPSGDADSSAPASEKLLRFNSNHYGPGERGGQFAPRGEGEAGGDTPSQVADSGQIATDAQVAQEEDPREEEESDFNAPVRAALYNSARNKLSAIDPSNPAAVPFAANPGWRPTQNDVNNMQDALDRAIEERAADVASHAYEKHILDSGEFPEIHSEIELQLRAQEIMKRAQAESAPNDRTFFYDRPTNTVVIVNTVQPSQSTMFRSPNGRAYIDQNVHPKKR